MWTDEESHQSAVCPPPLSSFLPTSGAELHSCDLLSSIFIERLSPWDSSLVNVDTPNTAWPPVLTLLVTGARDEKEEEEEEAEEEEEEEDEGEEEEEKYEKEEEGAEDEGEENEEEDAGEEGEEGDEEPEEF